MLPGIAGLSFLKKNINKLAGQKSLLCFVGGASPYEENAFLTNQKSIT